MLGREKNIMLIDFERKKQSKNFSLFLSMFVVSFPDGSDMGISNDDLGIGDDPGDNSYCYSKDYGRPQPLCFNTTKKGYKTLWIDLKTWGDVTPVKIKREALIV